MLQTFMLLYTQKPQFKKLGPILTQFFTFHSNYHYSTAAPLEEFSTPPHSKTNRTHKNLSSLNFSDIAKNVLSKCSHVWDTNKGESFNNFSLKDHFLRLSSISPEVIRRFWRVSVLNPQDVLEILLGFEFYSGKYEIEIKKVESLWGIFKWASEENKGFEHFPYSCKIMASMLVRVGLFREVEYLLSRRESQEILLDCQGIFSALIEGYVGEFDLDRGVSVYERMRGMSLVPSRSSYRALLKYLVELHETELMYRVYADMVEMGMGMSVEEKDIHDSVVRLLCINGEVQEARDLVKKAMNLGIEPSNMVINAITCGYCEKKDYYDLLSFFAEMKIVPDTAIGNKVLFSLCINFGVGQGNMFLRKLEELFFCPDEITFGILIGSSCCEENLKDVFAYISDILSRGLKPHKHSYNALLSGMIKEGMCDQSRDILAEMDDMGITPDLSTFKILLAGFCKARKFDEVKSVISQMEDRDLVKLSSSEDRLAKAFMLLGLNPSNVKIKRDNDKGSFKTEFFDDLGNGLYLDTDLNEYEKRIAKVLDDAMIPDFNFVLENCHSLDIKSTLDTVYEMVKWGQEMSLPALSSVLSHLCGARCSMSTINRIFEVIFVSAYHLDQKPLNMLVRVYSKRGLTFKARTLFDGMVRRGCIIENSTYSALMLELCKRGDLKSFHHCSNLAQKSNWFPEEKDGKALLGYLCKNKCLYEALQLVDIMIFVRADNAYDIITSFFEELCCQGLTSTAYVFLDEFSNQATISDHLAYDHLLRGFCLEKRFTEALTILDTMLSKRLPPPVDVTCQLIPNLCRTNNFEKAIAFKNNSLMEQPSPFLPIHCALINGFCKSGRIEEAAKIFKEVLLKGQMPEVEVFNDVIQSYCRENNFTKVKEILGAMIRRDVRISASTYSNIVYLICKEGKPFLALSLKELMLQVTNHPKLVLYNILIFRLSSTQRSSLLNAVIDSLQEKRLQFDTVTYNYVVQGFLLCKNVSRSLHYLTSMVAQDLKPSNRTLREVISFLCCNGELNKAMNLSQEMESRGWIHGSVIQNKIVEALLSNRKLHEAVHFLERMDKKGLIPDSITYDYLIKQFYLHGRLDKAVDLLNIMLQKRSAPDSTTYDYVIRGFCNCHKLDRALDFHTEMLYKGLEPSIMTWDILVRSLSEEGRAAEAEKLLNSMIQSGETPSWEMFGAVIDKYRSENNIGKASEVMKVMQEKGYVPDFDTHWSVISKLSNSNKRDDGNGKSSFLSSLLSGFGFAGKNKNSKGSN